MVGSATDSLWTLGSVIFIVEDIGVVGSCTYTPESHAQEDILHSGVTGQTATRTLYTLAQQQFLHLFVFPCRYSAVNTLA